MECGCKNKNGENLSINCTVQQCKYHGTKENHCTLDAISVGTHESNPTKKQCVDCESFEMKQ